MDETRGVTALGSVSIILTVDKLIVPVLLICYMAAGVRIG